MPFADWLRGPLHDVMHDALDARVVRDRGLLDPNAVAGIRDRFDRQQVGWAEPWLLMMLELWCREVLDSAARSGAAFAQSGGNTLGSAAAPLIGVDGAA
jgi:asparagine synthase (glutamine-hydrolysing)